MHCLDILVYTYQTQYSMNTTFVSTTKTTTKTHVYTVGNVLSQWSKPKPAIIPGYFCNIKANSSQKMFKNKCLLK